MSAQDQLQNLLKLLKRTPGLLVLIILLLLTTTAIAGVASLNRQAKTVNHNRPTPSVASSPTPSSIPSVTLTPTATPEPSIVPPTSVPTVGPTNLPVYPTHIPLQPEIAWGNRSYKQAIFTFDAGSGNQSISQILNTLALYKVEGAFFITGTWAEKYPNDLKRIAQNGHAIYNHTYTHPHLVQASDIQIKDELQRTDALIKSLVGFDSKSFFRAPYGERDARVLSVAASQGYRHVYWTIDAWDWKQGISSDEVKARILNNLQPGTIYLMHVGDTITGQILPEVFQEVRNRGYVISSLNQGIQ